MKLDYCAQAGKLEKSILKQVCLTYLIKRIGDGGVQSCSLLVCWEDLVLRGLQETGVLTELPLS